MSHLIQGSKEWLEFRKKYIGASDAAVLLGHSPWKTPYQLWEEKLGLFDQEEKKCMTRGKKMEEEAREYYSSLLNVEFSPHVKTKDIFMASLDGINEDKTIAIEIKCPNKKRVMEFHEEKLVPIYYYAQVQQQMYVYDLYEIYYVEYHPKILSEPIKVNLDEEFLNEYFDKARRFWFHVEYKIEPE